MTDKIYSGTVPEEPYGKLSSKKSLSVIRTELIINLNE